MYKNKCTRPTMVDWLFFQLLVTWQGKPKEKVKMWLKNARSSSLSHESFYLPTPSFCVRWLPWAESQQGVGQDELLLSSLHFFSFRPDDVLIVVLFKTASQAKVSQCPLSWPRTLSSHGYPGPRCFFPQAAGTIPSAPRCGDVSYFLFVSPPVYPSLSLFPLWKKQHNGKNHLQEKGKGKTVLTICLLNAPLVYYRTIISCAGWGGVKLVFSSRQHSRCKHYRLSFSS